MPCIKCPLVSWDRSSDLSLLQLQLQLAKATMREGSFQRPDPFSFVSRENHSQSNPADVGGEVDREAEIGKIQPRCQRRDSCKQQNLSLHAGRDTYALDDAIPSMGIQTNMAA